MMEENGLPKGWVETTLGEVVDIIMGQSPKGETCNENSIGMPLLNGPTEFGVISPIPIQYTTDPKKISNTYDLLFCVRGSTTGRMNWSNQKYAIGRGVAAIRHKNGIDYRKYVKAIIDYKLTNILTGATGTTFPNVSRNQLESTEILLPPLPEQKAIANILTSFDDKIELLQAQNETLETIAQTIFKEWFGKYQVGDELPEGWRVGKIKEFIVESIGGDYGKEVAIDDFTEKTVCLRGTDLPDMKMGVPQKAPIRFLKKSKLKNCKLINGDIVIEISGGTENQSTGRVAYINEEILNNSKFPMTCVNFCRILRPKNVENSYFIYSLFEYLYNRKVLFNWENGTTGIKNLNLKALLNVFNLALPVSDHKINEFNKYAKSSFIKIQSNNSQIQSLQTTRDTLLPKLMSGQLRVAEFKEQLSEVM